MMTETIKHGEPRFDALRPAVFDPADFEVVDYLDANDAGERGLVAAFVEDLARHGLTDRWQTQDGPGDIAVCDHCGHRGLRYLGIVKQQSTEAIYVFGSSCVARAGLTDLAEFKLIQLKGLAAARAERARLAEEAAHYLNDNADLRVFLEGIERGEKGDPQDSFDFVNSMDRALNKYGHLTEKQAAGLRKVIAKRPEYEKRQAERAAEDAKKGPAPVGRVEVEGIIVAVKWHDNGFEGELKMVVRLDNLSAVWVTVPKPLWEAYEASRKATNGTYPIAEWLINERTPARVRFTADFTVSDSDPHFAFGKRPTKCVIIEKED